MKKDILTEKKKILRRTKYTHRLPKICQSIKLTKKKKKKIIWVMVAARDFEKGNRRFIDGRSIPGLENELGER